MFPAETVAANPDLTLMAAWMARLGHSDLVHVGELLDRAESLVAQMIGQQEHAAHLRGEIATLRVILAYEAASDPERVIALAGEALATTPRAWYYVRSSAWIYLVLAHQMAGRLERAYATVAEGQPEDVAEDGAVRIRVAGALCFAEWIAGDLQVVSAQITHMLAASETHHRLESLGWAYYFLCSVAYQRNDLPTAEAHARTLEDLRYVSRPMAYLQGAFVHSIDLPSTRYAG